MQEIQEIQEREEIKGLGDYLTVLLRRKKQFMIAAAIILAISVLLAVGLPSIYQSKATILIEQQEIPTDLVRSTVTSYAGERIQVISQKVMTTDNLSKIINDYDLYKTDRKTTSMAVLVEEMREEINLEMISADVIDPLSGKAKTATIAFTLSFNSKNARTSQKVTNELVSLFLNTNLEKRAKSAIETTGFLAAESKKLESKVAKLEESLAEFKEKNINNLPELQELNIQLMNRSENDLKAVEQQIRSLDERKIYLTSELAQISPDAELISYEGKRILGPRGRLKELQTEYITLSTRYSATHPDLIKMEKEIAALRKEVGSADEVEGLRMQIKDLKTQQAVLQEKYSPEHPDVKKVGRNVEKAQIALKKAIKESEEEEVESGEPDNPVYIQLQSQLEAASSELKSLRELRKELKAKVKDFEERLTKSPQVERKYRDLTRDYDNAVGKYKEVKAKQLEAELAEALERENKGERFSLIEPPLLPEKPAKPNRMAILLLGIIFSMAGGVSTVAVAEALSDSIKDIDGLIQTTGEPPLVTIPYIEVEAEKEQQHVYKSYLVKGVIVAVVLTVVLFHFAILPLDVLWFVVMRRLGIGE
jgi:uncharacterized protein involved in exopolysaccharide biosynthesis